jgi:hypothetical protein
MRADGGESECLYLHNVVLHHVHIGASSKGACLFDGAINIRTVGFMIAGDIKHRSVSNTLKKPRDPALHPGDEITGNDEQVVTRPICHGGQVPTARQLHVQIGLDPEQQRI